MLLIDRDAEIRRRLADEIEREGRYRTIGLDSFAALDGAEALGPFALSDIQLAVVTVEDRLEPADLEKLLGLPVLALVPAGAPPVEQAAATLNKPLRLTILLETIAQLIETPVLIPMGAAWLDLRLKRLFGRDGQSADWAIRLTEKEAAVLACLHRANHAIVPREQLLEDVWGYSQSVTTHTVETHIYRLRRKIDARAELTGLLITEPGGYRLAADKS